MIAESGLRQIRHSEERRRLRDIDAEVARATSALPEDEVELVWKELEDLLHKRRDLLDTALSTDAAYLQALGELDFAHNRLFDTAEAYDDFLAERLLWIRSTPPVNLTVLLALPEEIRRLLSLDDWFKVLEILAHRFIHSPEFMLVVILIAVLLWHESQIKHAIAATGGKLGKPTTDRFAYTLQAIAMTLLVVLPWPLLVAVVGWQLRFAIEVTEFSKAVGITLRWMALPIYSLMAFRLLCQPHGVAALHFRWQESSLRPLRKAIRRLMIFFSQEALSPYWSFHWIP